MYIIYSVVHSTYFTIRQLYLDEMKKTNSHFRVITADIILQVLQLYTQYTVTDISLLYYYASSKNVISTQINSPVAFFALLDEKKVAFSFHKFTIFHQVVDYFWKEIYTRHQIVQPYQKWYVWTVTDITIFSRVSYFTWFSAIKSPEIILM